MFADLSGLCMDCVKPEGRGTPKIEKFRTHATVNEPCLYYGWRNFEIMLVIVYVDDLIVAA